MRRKLAAWVLRNGLQYLSPASRQWALGMLRELDFIEGDWAALFWALGSTIAIFEHSVDRSWLLLRSGGYPMSDTLKRILGILSGAAIAALLAIVAVAFVTLAFRFFPAFAEQATWFPWLTLLVIPVIAFVCIGAALWRKEGLWQSAFFSRRLSSERISRFTSRRTETANPWDTRSLPGFRFAIARKLSNFTRWHSARPKSID